MRRHHVRLYLLAILCLTLTSGCTKRLDPGPGDLPLSHFSMNISAGDLLDSRTASKRLATYLDELAAQGYKKQVRIILPPDWGPFIYQHWFPALRARGFKVLAILGQERRDSAADVPCSIAWIKHIVPLVRKDLVGIQIVNEHAHSFAPEEYAAYHMRIAPLIRSLAPEVPIVAGDFGVLATGDNTLARWKAAVAAGADDYDVLSIHVTGVTKEYKLEDFARRLKQFGGPGRRIWITEGDWGQLQFLRGQGLNIEEDFVYTWNDDQDPALIRRRLSGGGNIGHQLHPRSRIKHAGVQYLSGGRKEDEVPFLSNMVAFVSDCPADGELFNAGHTPHNGRRCGQKRGH